MEILDETLKYFANKMIDDFVKDSIELINIIKKFKK